VHLPYLVNLATPDQELFRKSLNTLAEDLKRSAMIGASFLIMHVGSAQDANQGLRRITEGINNALDKVKNKVKLLLENTAGSGNELGHDFAQLQKIIQGIKDRKRIGIALDTAHAFAAGYDLRTHKAINRTLDDFGRIIGFNRLNVIHLNDSKTERGSRKDRHWHIGRGRIGHGMDHLLHHPALQDLPFIMETPRTNLKEDIMNMQKVKQILAGPAGRLPDRAQSGA
jgi:deoxyribonuclease-4